MRAQQVVGKCWCGRPSPALSLRQATPGTIVGHRGAADRAPCHPRPECTVAILKIARMGHPVLLEQCQPIPDPGAPEIRRLVQDMFETMEDAPGAGLAAPQVHVPLRVFVPGGAFTRQRDAG